MGKLIELSIKRTKMEKLPIEPIWSLRWRIIAENGIQVTSSWLPETRYPSIRETLQEFGGNIRGLFIDGKHGASGEITNFLRCPGAEVASLTFKAMGISGSRGPSPVIGIEVEDVDGVKYLVLRDGTVFVEERTPADVANNN